MPWSMQGRRADKYEARGYKMIERPGQGQGRVGVYQAARAGCVSISLDISRSAAPVVLPRTLEIPCQTRMSRDGSAGSRSIERTTGPS